MVLPGNPSGPCSPSGTGDSSPLLHTAHRRSHVKLPRCLLGGSLALVALRLRCRLSNTTRLPLSLLFIRGAPSKTLQPCSRSTIEYLHLLTPCCVPASHVLLFVGRHGVLVQFAGSPPGTVKLVCGNTSYGVEKYFNATGVPTPYSAFIDVTGGCRHGALFRRVGWRLGHVF